MKRYRVRLEWLDGEYQFKGPYLFHWVAQIAAWFYRDDLWFCRTYVEEAP